MDIIIIGDLNGFS